jgi:hypothetical protein
LGTLKKIEQVILHKSAPARLFAGWHPPVSDKANGDIMVNGQAEKNVPGCGVLLEPLRFCIYLNFKFSLHNTFAKKSYEILLF